MVVSFNRSIPFVFANEVHLHPSPGSNSIHQNGWSVSSSKRNSVLK